MQRKGEGAVWYGKRWWRGQEWPKGKLAKHKLVGRNVGEGGPLGERPGIGLVKKKKLPLRVLVGGRALTRDATTSLGSSQAETKLCLLGADGPARCQKAIGRLGPGTPPCRAGPRRYMHPAAVP